MKKKYGYILIIVLVIIIIAVIFFIAKGNLNNESNNLENNSANNVARLATKSNALTNQEQANELNKDKLNEVNNRVENVLSNNAVENKVTEEEISSYSTKLGGSTENRLTNIRITCGKLNGTVVSSGDTFSFCDLVGPSTAEEGYKEATVIVDGKKEQALGGGNCQISSTLYNAILAVPDLSVVERHEHGRDVSYVPDGKDAAVAYGSIDFRFKNNSSNNIKLYFDTDDVTLTVKIVKLT